MGNMELLKNTIAQAGVSRTALAAALGMSMPTFYSRLNGNSEFNASEIVAATAFLGLTKRQRDAIFFDE